MAAPIIAGSLGGYSAEFLTPEQCATFSSCTKADSDMMYWAIQNKEINMAAVIMERMKFARDQIWDTKSKFNVSLPYAHLLTKIFKHFGVDLSWAVVEKMGQAIRSRNLKKSGFSVESGVWFKASVAKGEAIIIDTSVVHPEMGSADMTPELLVESILAPAVEAAESSRPSIAKVQSESAVEEERASVEASRFPEESVQTFAERRIEDLLPEDIIPVEDPLPSTGVVPFGCEGRPSGIQGVVPFECEGRPAELGVVASLGGLFPSGQADLVLLNAPNRSDDLLGLLIQLSTSSGSLSSLKEGGAILLNHSMVEGPPWPCSWGTGAGA
ncbi:hypothetical protein Taro_019858 [Colocasia esculenta]|uniref:Uncharacterized protein n=1 Tax=Colocasia esculenta TaxID=4460 RepID=A0A843V0F1_COLES|nr:hypothetical protein [Colocasia esculenta]